MSEKATKANTGGQAASGTPDKERVRHNLTIAAGAIGRMQQCLGEQVNETLTTITPARTGKETPEQLAQQTAETLVTPDGKAALKKAIAEGVAAADEGLHITDVLFSEFVVQF